MKDECFFRFGSKLYSTTFQAHAIELDKIPDPSGTILRDHDRLIFGEYNDICFPVVFQHAHGEKMYDILDTGWPCLYLVSEWFKQALEENHLRGWKVFPIKLLNKKGNEILGYHGLSITGRSGPIDYSSSQIIQKRFYEGGPFWKYYKGYRIDLNQWDGSDFFKPRDVSMIVVTSTAANILKRGKITNLCLENLLDIEISESTMLERLKFQQESSNSDS